MKFSTCGLTFSHSGWNQQSQASQPIYSCVGLMGSLQLHAVGQLPKSGLNALFFSSKSARVKNVSTGFGESSSNYSSVFTLHLAFMVWTYTFW